MEIFASTSQFADLADQSFAEASDPEVSLGQIQSSKDIVDGTESHEKADVACAGFFDFDIDVSIVIAQSRVVQIADCIDIDTFEIADCFKPLLRCFQFSRIESLSGHEERFAENHVALRRSVSEDMDQPDFILLPFID